MLESSRFTECQLNCANLIENVLICSIYPQSSHLRGLRGGVVSAQTPQTGTVCRFRTRLTHFHMFWFCASRTAGGAARQRAPRAAAAGPLRRGAREEDGGAEEEGTTAAGSSWGEETAAAGGRKGQRPMMRSGKTHPVKHNQDSGRTGSGLPSCHCPAVINPDFRREITKRNTKNQKKVLKRFLCVEFHH